jgi:hypothetical protein
MVVESYAPGNSFKVHIFLATLGFIAMLGAFSLIGWIVFSYVTNEERRNPEPLIEEHSVIPSLLLRV